MFSMFSHVEALSEIHSFLWMNNILLYAYTTFYLFIYLVIQGPLDYSYLLAVVNNAAKIIALQISEDRNLVISASPWSGTMWIHNRYSTKYLFCAFLPIYMPFPLPRNPSPCSWRHYFYSSKHTFYLPRKSFLTAPQPHANRQS